jgi:zinc D-Ala-D-Ala carboxypeptidase
LCFINNRSYSSILFYTEKKMNYFNITEFDSPDHLGSGKAMKQHVLDMLDEARGKFDKPMVINSGYRTESHNEKVGGVKNSAHLGGYAADISCRTSRDRYHLINCLLDVGFNRIGVAGTFIHVDADPDKDPDIMWTY